MAVSVLANSDGALLWCRASERHSSQFQIPLNPELSPARLVCGGVNSRDIYEKGRSEAELERLLPPSPFPTVSITAPAPSPPAPSLFGCHQECRELCAQSSK